MILAQSFLFILNKVALQRLKRPEFTLWLAKVILMQCHWFTIIRNMIYAIWFLYWKGRMKDSNPLKDTEVKEDIKLRIQTKEEKQKWTLKPILKELKNKGRKMKLLNKWLRLDG